MRRFLVLIHDDASGPQDVDAWGPYLDGLRSSGRLLGGSSLAPATSHRREGVSATAASDVVGYLLIDAADADDAASVITDNPSFVAGATIDIHELVVD